MKVRRRFSPIDYWVVIMKMLPRNGRRAKIVATWVNIGSLRVGKACQAETKVPAMTGFKIKFVQAAIYV